MGRITEEIRSKLLPELEAKEQEVMAGLKDFQRKTVQRIDHLYGEGQDRVLVADEVGLGKTMIAKGVLAKMAVRRCNEGDDLFKVTYICSNQAIATQNLQKLDIYKTGYDDITETRLSMQHLKVMQQELGINDKSRSNPSSERKYVQLIPLTPATSFRTTGDMAGTVRERALMFVILRDMEGIDVKRLEMMMVQYAPSSWNWVKEKYQNDVAECHRLNPSYLADIQSTIAKHDTFRELLHFLEKFDIKASRYIIGKLRMMFAEISIDMLNPDLVIMDEFQRFQFMLEHSTGEMSMLAERFLRAKSENIDDKVRVLLLSATPYKLYSTLEEVGENARNDSYREFLSVMHFLKEGGANDFDQVWNEYSYSLQHITRDNINQVREASRKAGDNMYKSMCRTERLSVMNEGDFVDDSSKNQAVSVTEKDILSYQAAMRLMNAIDIDSLLPIDYVKSCPYLLSFMQKYELKEKITRYFREHPDEVELCHDDLLWIKERIGYNHIPVTNARYDRLQRAVLGDVKDKSHPELLLWMPPTVPYYTPSGVFAGKDNFSKMMVFSSWEMVPRMVSCLLSHEVESRIAIKNVGLLPIRLKDKAATTRLLSVCVPQLANAYTPREFVQDGVTDIRVIEKKVRENIRIIPSEIDELLPEDMKEDVRWQTAVDIAIASPASCLYRITHDTEASENVAKAFVDYLNTPEKTTIIQQATESKRKNDAHWQDVLTYCKQGNLQAVFDEYAYYITDGNNMSPDALANTMIAALGLRTTNYAVETFTRFRNKVTNARGDTNEGSRGMRSHFATAFAQGTGDKQQDRQKALQRSFNSPFWPFVLASTSIGQEGLDFHPYCRKIMHWNLPGNPVDLEQREGRINRYKCLAIRQNIALTYGAEVKAHWMDGNLWNHLFKAAEAERSQGHSELIPFWCLGPNQKIMIERILANYPISIDETRYDRLIKVLSLYRLTMGQARQSELLEYVFKEFKDPSILKDLYISLSPYEREQDQEKINAL